MGLFDKKPKKEPTEYASNVAYIEHRKKSYETKIYDDRPRYYVLNGQKWTPTGLTSLENYLRENKIVYESYPLKNGSWEIRYYGKHIGNWDGFEYAGFR